MISTTHHIQREQMSISSITSDQTQGLHYHSTGQQQIYSKDHYYKSHISSQYHSYCSPPHSPEQSRDLIHSPPSSPHSYSSSYREEEETTATTTLQERRQRNKAASAKYRQKKNMQQCEMRNMIQQISERNALLERQLREVREENHKLRATADKLRGKFVAKKMLRQWMDRHHRLPLPILSNDLLDDQDDDDSDSVCSDL